MQSYLTPALPSCHSVSLLRCKSNRILKFRGLGLLFGVAKLKIAPRKEQWRYKTMCLVLMLRRCTVLFLIQDTTNSRVIPAQQSFPSTQRIPFSKNSLECH